MENIIIEHERCKGCKLCIDVCIKKALSLSGSINKKGYKTIVCDDNSCNGCGMCAIMCPDVVFSVYR